MKWQKLLSVLLVWLLAFFWAGSALAYSQEIPTISLNDWSRLNAIVSRLSMLNAELLRELTISKENSRALSKQIDDLTKQSAQLRERLATSTQELTGLQESLSNLEISLASLEKSLSEARAEAGRIQTENTICKIGAVLAGIVAAAFAVAFFAK